MNWNWGTPVVNTAGDPNSAHGGVAVIGNNVGDPARYGSGTRNFVRSPIIDVSGHTDLHLQYWRWLSVEDRRFDQARIYVNGASAWENERHEHGGTQDDGEWRFHDIPIDSYLSEDLQSVQVRYELSTDLGVELGGWSVDDFCIVAHVSSVCGDGLVSGAEACDEGASNSDLEADTCRSSCVVASCGDGVVDMDEDCDGEQSCQDCKWIAPEDTAGCGCMVQDRNSSLMALLLLLVFRFRSGRRAGRK